MNLVELKEFIDAHHCSDDASWQRVVFDELFERFSVIPIVSGVYGGSTSEEIATERKVCDRKAAVIPNWQQYCTERNATKPNWGDKIGICTGLASGIRSGFTSLDQSTAKLRWTVLLVMPPI